MKNVKIVRILFPIVYGAIMTLLIGLMTPFLFGKVIQTEIELPLFLTGVIGLFSGVLLTVMCVRGRKLRWIILAAVLLFLSQSIVSISQCKSNSIRFADVAGSLIRVVTGNSGVENRDSEIDYVKNIEVLGSSSSQADSWTVGFGSAQIIPKHLRTDPLYIAGYNSGWKTSKYLDNYELEVYSEINENRERRSWYDYAQARAVWMDTGEGGVLLIGIDGIALSGNYVRQIREQLSALCEKENCVSVNVYATHSHALPDTLGLWGPLGVDGKDPDYMEKLVEAAVDAAEEAIENRHTGQLYYGKAVTDGEYLLRDSRYPYVYDDNLHQIRFEGEDGFGVRMLLYGAHAESLRGDNTLLSRDFPGIMCDLVTAETGDHTIFLPGAIGGLIMTEVLTTPFDAVENVQKTGRELADYVLAITPESEERIAPELSMARAEISVPLDNNAFLYYQFLGILNCTVEESDSRTGYSVISEMSLLKLGDMAVALIPGELFPELVSGERYGDAAPEQSNPAPLRETAASFGTERLLILGLANDELGYIVPPSDFLVNETNPYLERKEDARGEDHYEETNSVGPECAEAVAQAFEKLCTCISEIQ